MKLVSIVYLTRTPANTGYITRTRKPENPITLQQITS